MSKAIYLLIVLTVSLTAHSQLELRTEQGGERVTTLAANTAENANQIVVRCGSPNAKVHTITDALKLIGRVRPAVLLISGTCRENVAITSLDRVTLQGNPTATIDGGADPNVGTVEIADSQSILLSNLTITAGGEGVGCFGQSLCRLNQVTIQNSLADGAAVGVRAHMQFADSVIQNNASVGLSIGAGSANFFGGSITGNADDGVSMSGGGFLGIAAGDLVPNVTISNNSGNGITAGLHNSVTINSADIRGNAFDGISLQAGSSLRIAGSSVSSNGGHQIRIGDLSLARFGGLGNAVTGTNAPDVVCDPVFSATRNFANLAGTTTNCPAELPAIP
jgi:hypothetical protein